MTALTHIEPGNPDEARVDRVQFSAAAGIGSVSKDGGNGKWAEGNATTELLAGRDGVGLLTQPVAAADGYGQVLRSGKAFVAPTLTVGEVYVMAGATNEVELHSALASTEWVTALFIVKATAGSTSEIVMSPIVSGAQKP